MIRRSPRRDRWVVIDNETIRDDRLSWKARGLLAYLLSMPDNWTARIEDLAQRGPDGKEAVRTGLVELEATGYLVRSKERRSDGTYEHFATVHERPVCPESDSPTLDLPTSENRTVSSTQEEVPIQDQESGGSDSSTPAKRPRDVLFETIAEVCGIDWQNLTRSARGSLNRAVAEIRPLWDGTEQQVRRKAAEYRGRMPDAVLSANALAKWWPSLNGSVEHVAGGTGSVMRAVAGKLGETGG